MIFNSKHHIINLPLCIKKGGKAGERKKSGEKNGEREKDEKNETLLFIFISFQKSDRNNKKNNSENVNLLKENNV